MKKKLLAACALCVVLACLLTVPAMAHGHGSHGHTAAYPQCPVEDCQLTYRHSHDGVTYCAHARDDGHSQHVSCDQAGCTSLGSHSHHSGGHRHSCHR